MINKNFINSSFLSESNLELLFIINKITIKDKIIRIEPILSVPYSANLLKKIFIKIKKNRLIKLKNLKFKKFFWSKIFFKKNRFAKPKKNTAPT